MALPPTPTPAAPPPGAGAPPPAMGADMAAGPDDMGDDETAEGEPEVIATICKNADGTFTLYAGDEPEEMEGAEMGEASPEGGNGMAAGGPGMPPEGGPPAPVGKTFDTPQDLVRGLLPLLSDTNGAEDAFGAGFKGGKGDMGGPPMMGKGGM